MKVTGTGNPASLTLRLREREVAGLKEELDHRAAVADDATASSSSPRAGRCGPDEILVAVTAMLDQLAATSANEQGRVVVSGPTWLLAPAIRGATAEAAEHLVSVLRRFARDGDAAPEDLRDAIAAASAWSETLMGSEHVLRHGLPA